MALSEYVIPNDFFQYDDSQPDHIGFPCCCCRNNKKESREMPCNICGHNECAEEYFNCSLCGDVEVGAPKDENYIAIRTPASIGPICLTCKNTLASELNNQ